MTSLPNLCLANRLLIEIPHMIIEMRTYVLHPGKAPDYLKLFEEEGYDIQVPIFGNLIGYFSTEIGPINQIIHMWGFESHAERDRRRAILQSSPEWLAFVKKIRPLVQSQQNAILKGASFSPIR